MGRSKTETNMQQRSVRPSTLRQQTEKEACLLLLLLCLTPREQHRTNARCPSRVVVLLLLSLLRKCFAKFFLVKEIIIVRNESLFVRVF